MASLENAKQTRQLIWQLSTLTLALVLPSLVGCDTITFRPQSPDDLDRAIVDINDDQIHFVGEISVPYGLSWAEIKSVALVANLNETGSAPSPSSMRDRLLNEMKARGVSNPSSYLEEKNNSMVIVQGFLRPGIRKGDRFDLWVQVPSNSRTTSLSNGNLLQTRMRPMANMGTGNLLGHEVAIGEGFVLTEALFEKGDASKDAKGRVLGGGVSNENRTLGLMINSDSSVATEARAVTNAINARFDTIDYGTRVGVANAVASNKVELLVPRQYKQNLNRYINVVGSVAFNELPLQRASRIERLEQELNEPFLSSRAALRLEAIGLETVGILKRAINSRDLEVRFYAAETLAYMGQSEAAPVLAEIAKTEYAFRWHALTALSSMDDVEAGIALSELLHETSIETRYGAFRALQARSKDDPALGSVGGIKEFYYHTIASNAPPIIHISRARRPEVVLFGMDQKVSTSFVYAPAGLTIRPVTTSNGVELEITRYLAREGDQKLTCSRRLDDLIRTIVKLGGDYQTVVEMLRTVNEDGYLETKLVVDALPRPGRRRELGAEPSVESDLEGSSDYIAGPLPTLFRQASTDEIEETMPVAHDLDDEEEEPAGKKGFFGNLTSFWTD